ncbi:hypothetical protein EDB92DRAFT_1898219 [Lactarius akahatsu]|uniref:C3H1-type domain-containing protein n=1 Tax=Lactarius akahatsu TaxID=416441 RepID=A0AAD4L2X2_9AGAM|nr:hypothetical protein EDB92DRAFT_1922495 [Lactarius akahatsu]KAH8981250.1 hypothetical protein EDB92DRAFT_1898219 [Lactarius akahatsu]
MTFQGNAHFRKGEYREAIAEYEVAVKIHGPTATYLSNMAAAWLKLEAYDAAEQCAKRALCIDPKFAKARFRRGQARKGNLQLTAAGVDFATVLEQNPDSTETKKALDEVLVLMRERNEEDEPIESEDCRPRFNVDSKVELESVSDSSDFNHEGNGVPCRSYNHDGCKQGLECRFSHTPDYKSVRDRLGRNVCLHFLLGDCRVSSCVYSHDKTYLPSGRWWGCEWKLAEIRDMSRWPFCKQNPAVLPLMFAIIDNRMAWKPAQAAKPEDAYVWRDSIMMLEGFGDATDDLGYAAFISRGMGSGGSRGHDRSGDWGGMRCGGSSRHGGLGLDNFAERVARVNRGHIENEIQPEQVCQCQGIWDHDDDAFDVDYYIEANSL